MQEHIRPHERVDGSECIGERIKINDMYEVPVDLFIPESLAEEDTADLVIHFHGNPSVTEWAACSTKRKFVLVTINFGSGSSTYEQPLLGDRRITYLIDRIRERLDKHGIIINRKFLSGFSAGYGSIRAILTDPPNYALVDGILLLDGLHTDYVPKGQVLSQGGKLNISKLQPFLDFAVLATKGDKAFIFTHSSIFPGTFASTTECADYLIEALGLSRTPVLQQGPLGMQHVGLTEKNGFKILAFTGNTAPDHIDHLHGFYYFIDLLMQE